MTGLEALNKIDEVLCDIEIKHKENLGYTKPLTKTIKKSLKALEIIKEHIKFEDRGIETYTDDSKNLVTKFLIRLESKDTGATIHIHLDTKEEFNLLKEVLE